MLLHYFVHSLDLLTSPSLQLLLPLALTLGMLAFRLLLYPVELIVINTRTFTFVGEGLQEDNITLVTLRRSAPRSTP